MAIVINGSGTVTGISVGGLPDDIVDAGTLADNAVGLAQMAGGTDGNIITYDTSGNPAAVATGSAGQVLTSAGADAVPTMATLSAGKVLQVVNAIQATEVVLTSSTYTDTGLTASITPSATSSKILVICSNDSTKYGADDWVNFRCYRDATEIGGTIIGRRIGDTDDSGKSQSVYSFTILDSPSSTSALTYKTQFNTNSGSASCRINHGSGSSTICLMEIGA
jgi:hypothetical protein